MLISCPFIKFYELRVRSGLVYAGIVAFRSSRSRGGIEQRAFEMIPDATYAQPHIEIFYRFVNFG